MRPSLSFLDLTAASRDVVEHIWGLLPLPALGALLCACRGLRKLLVDTPDAWRAAAAHEHGRHHPVALCEDPLGYLKRHHNVLATIAAGRCKSKTKHLYPHQNVAVSIDACT